MKRIHYLFLFLFSITFASCFWDSDGNSSSGYLNGSGQQSTDVLFLMYMDGDNNLNDVAWTNIMQAQVGLIDISSNASITVLALVDGNIEDENGTYANGKTYLLKLGAYSSGEYTYNSSTMTVSVSKLIASATEDYSMSVSWIYNGSGRATQEVDMSTYSTLYNFLNLANYNFKASKVILAMQNHGGGPYNELTTSYKQKASRTLCWDETSGGTTYLSTTDVVKAIQNTFGKIDLLIEDVCLQGTIEEIYGLQNAVNYLVASPNTTYGNTFNYNVLIPYMTTGASVTEIGKRFVDYNYAICKGASLRTDETSSSATTCMELSLHLYDCSKTDVLTNIKNHTSDLAAAIMSSNDSDRAYCTNRLGRTPKNTDSAFYGFSFEASYVYTNDLGAFAYLIANSSISDSSIKSAAANLLSDLRDNSLIVYGWSGGSENNWYYSGNSSYGSSSAGSFLKITDGKCPWGLGITGGCLAQTFSDGTGYYFPITNYGSWSAFASGNKWTSLLTTYKSKPE